MVTNRAQNGQVSQPGDPDYVDFRLRRRFELELERTNGDVAKAMVAYENAKQKDVSFLKKAFELREQTVIATVEHTQKLAEMRVLIVAKVEKGELAVDSLEMFDALFAVSKGMGFQAANATYAAYLARRGLG